MEVKDYHGEIEHENYETIKSCLAETESESNVLKRQHIYILQTLYYNLVQEIRWSPHGSKNCPEMPVFIEVEKLICRLIC